MTIPYGIPDGVEINPLLNGNMQAGDDTTALSATGKILTAYTLTAGTSAVVAASRQSHTLGQTDVPGEPAFFLRASASAAGTTPTSLQNRIEDVRTFANRKDVVLQGWYKSDQDITVALRQNCGSGGSPSVERFALDNNPATLTTLWTASAVYAAGAAVVNQGRRYIATTGGTAAGSGGPTGTGQAITDNTVIWAYDRPAGQILPRTVNAAGVAVWRRFALPFAPGSLAGLTIGSTANTSYLAVEFLLAAGVATQLDLDGLSLAVGSGARPIIRFRTPEAEQLLLNRYYRAFTSTGTTPFLLTPRMRVVGTASSGTWNSVDVITPTAAAMTLDARL